MAIRGFEAEKAFATHLQHVLSPAQPVDAREMLYGRDEQLTRISRASPGYRDDLGGGSPLAANGSEIVRADARTRHQATEGFRAICEKAAPFMQAQGNEDRMDTAISLLTNMTGALTMSRMVDDPTLSEQILEVTRRRIAKTFDMPRSASRESSIKRGSRVEQKRSTSSTPMRP